MNRLLIPAAVAALVIGCARPAVTGLEQYSAEPYYVPPETTVIVREVRYQEPVVYVDTVYMAADPEPVQPVYVTEEYNEYNEYNHTDVYVRQTVPPPPVHHRKPGWSPRRPDPPPRGRGRDEKPPKDRNQPRDGEKPKVIDPNPPVKPRNVPVTNERQKSPTPPMRQVPGGGVQVTQVQSEAPRQAPTPTVEKVPAPVADDAQVSLTRPVRK
jgi:hypothetical protein